MSDEALDPNKTMCVCKAGGKEVGRVRAAAPNATAYIDALVREHGGLKIDYEEMTEGEQMVANLFG